MKLLIIYAWHICINKTMNLLHMSTFRPHFPNLSDKVSRNTYMLCKTTWG